MEPLRREILSNGLTVVLAPLEHLHRATVALFVRAGSRYEDERTNGLSHFLEHMLFRGTIEHPTAYQLNHAIEDLGGTLYGATHVDFTHYQLTLPHESLEAGLRLLGEVIRSPLFRDLDVEKRILKEEILEDLDEDGQEIDVDNIAREALFRTHPLGFTITGSPSHIDSFGAEDLRAHMRRHYGAANIVLCVAGLFDAERVLAEANASFGTVPAGRRAHVELPDLGPPERRFTYVRSQGSQTDIRISFPTFGIRHPSFVALQLLGRVLDDGMSTRLHRRICDETGLAYDAFGSLDIYEDCGVFDLGASVEHAKTPRVIRELLGLMKELRDVQLSPSELDKARRRYLWDLRGMRDDDDATASFHGLNALFDMPTTLESLTRKVSEATPDDVQRVARTLLETGHATIACVGLLPPDLRDAARAELDALR